MNRIAILIHQVSGAVTHWLAKQILYTGYVIQELAELMYKEK